MNAVKGLFNDGAGNFTVKKEPDRALAIKLMNDEAYHKNKVNIMRPIDEFYAMFARRTAGDVAKHERRSMNLLQSLGMLITVIMGMFLYSFVVIQRQIAERQRAEEAFRASSQKLALHFQQTPLGVIEWDTSFRVARWNPAAEKIFGFTAEEAIGQHGMFIVPESAHGLVGTELENLLKGDAGERSTNENVRKDGAVILCGWYNTSLTDAEGHVVGVASQVEDITERKRADNALRTALREKESLLKEVHHRVNNNLQVITSLLRLEAGRSNEPGTKTVLQEMQNRIRSMALLHETLYRSENLERVDLPGYIQRLTTHLFRSMVAEPGSIQLRLDLAPVSLELDQAVPCGLLINELVSNCLKHGFPDGRMGEVRIDLQLLQLVDGGQEIRLRVSDTGVGLPTDFEERRTQSLGLQLVSDLAKQLKGQLDVSGEPGKGAVFEVTFAPKKQADSEG